MVFVPKERGYDLGDVIVVGTTFRRSLICYQLDHDALFLRLMVVPIDALHSECRARRPYDGALLLVKDDWLMKIWAGETHNRRLPGWWERRKVLRSLTRPMVLS